MKESRKSTNSPRLQASSPGVQFCVVGETLCELHLWTEAEWQQLDVADRPSVMEHLPGLGWIGAVLKRPKP